MTTREPQDDAREGAGSGPDKEEGPAGEDDGGAKSRLSDGLKQGLGVLSALRDALEETIQEARERGELSSERAKEMVQRAMRRTREAAGEAKERLDFVPQAEFDRLREQVDELKVRLQNLEQRASQDPSAGPARPAGGDRGEEVPPLEAGGRPG